MGKCRRRLPGGKPSSKRQRKRRICKLIFSFVLVFHSHSDAHDTMSIGSLSEVSRKGLEWKDSLRLFIH